jgi:3-hydroxymyristoyl/3-hydroxydecanoyl-(acyl carrier protein) dehydratase
VNFRHSIATAKISGPDFAPDGAATFTFRFPANNPTFAGHFPTRPLLPGIYQVEMACHCAAMLTQRSLCLREVTKSKFLRPILPEETIRVELKSAEKTGMLQIRASFSVLGQPAGETILLLVPES